MEEIYTFTPRNEDEYLQSRVAEQIEWYDKNSIKNKRWYIRLKVAELTLSLSVPILTSLIANADSPYKIISMIVAALVSLIAGLITIKKYHEYWVGSRTVAEMLKFEKFLFATRYGAYKNDPNAFNTFVVRFEGIIANSTKKWSEDSSNKTKNGGEKGGEKLS
jgi:hypothetical protein